MKKATISFSTILFLGAAIETFGQGSAFTYQGRLNASGNPATGYYDFQFILYDAPVGGTEQGPILTNSPTTVSNGLFTVTLDFGNQFPGADRWLDISVRTNAGGAFAPLAPRQKLTPTPYAQYAAGAATAASANSVAAANIAGTLPDAKLSANVALRAGGNTFSSDQHITSGDIYLDNTHAIWAKNSSGATEVFAWPRYADNVTYMNYGAGGFNIRNNPGATAMFMANSGNIGIGTATPGANTLQINTNFIPANGYGLVVNKGDFGEDIQINRTAGQGGIGLVLDNASLGDASTSLLLLRNDVNASPQNVLNVAANGDILANGTLNLNTATYPGVTAFIRARPADSLPLAVQNNIGNLLLVSSNGDTSVMGTISAGGGFVGSGSSLTGLNATQLTSGTVADARLSANVALRSGGNTFNGSQFINGALNVNGSYPGVTAFIHTQPGDNLPLAVQGDAGNLLLVSSNGQANVAGSFYAGNGSSRFGFNGSFNNYTMVVRENPSDIAAFGVLDSGGNPIMILFNGSPNSLELFGTAADNQGQVFWNTFSDERLKQDVHPFAAGLNELLRLQTIKYRFRDGIKPGMTSTEEHVGVIAQRVQEVFPDAVQQDKGGYLMLHPDPIFWASINAIQELNQKLEQKATEITELKNELSELKGLVQAMNQKLNGGGQ